MFDLQRKLLIVFLENFLQAKQAQFKSQEGWNKDLFERLKTFITKGKLIRGSLLLQSYLLFKDNISEDAIKAAAALELIHSSVLIHDDIIDNDQLRRGKKTIEKQYEEFALKHVLPNAIHFGQSMGICAGDIGFFLGFQLLALVKHNNLKKITEYFTNEFISVGFAQMQDIFAVSKTPILPEKLILDLYKNKTGRYTFSLPLVIGAMLALQEEKVIQLLEKLGESLGILFQLKDDELDIFGDQKIIGKPIGSDIKGNKKTLLRMYLYSHSSKNEIRKLNTIFGNQQISSTEINYIKDLVNKLQIEKKINLLKQRYERKAKIHISKLPLSQQKQQLFLHLLSYNLERKK